MVFRQGQNNHVSVNCGATCTSTRSVYTAVIPTSQLHKIPVPVRDRLAKTVEVAAPTSEVLTSDYTTMDITRDGIAAFITDALLDNKQGEDTVVPTENAQEQTVPMDTDTEEQ